MKKCLEAYANWMDAHVGVYGIEPWHLMAVGAVGMAIGVGMIVTALR